MYFDKDTEVPHSIFKHENISLSVPKWATQERLTQATCAIWIQVVHLKLFIHPINLGLIGMYKSMLVCNLLNLHHVHQYHPLPALSGHMSFVFLLFVSAPNIYTKAVLLLLLQLLS